MIGTQQTCVRIRDRTSMIQTHQTCVRIRNRTSMIRTHKFRIRDRTSMIRTHKFSIRDRISMIRIHKTCFRIRDRTSMVRTHQTCVRIRDRTSMYEPTKPASGFEVGPLMSHYDAMPIGLSGDEHIQVRRSYVFNHYEPMGFLQPYITKVN